MSDDWISGDPFANPDDPAAREREQRRREREEKRRGREEKRQERAAKQGEEATAPPPPAPPEPDPADPATPRPFEREFWDDDADGPGGGSIGDTAPPRPVAEERDTGYASGNGAGPGGPGGDGVLGSLRRHPLRIFATLAALFALWFLFALFQPLKGDGSGEVEVAIPKGASVSEVGDLLGEKGVIDSSTLFQVRVTLAGKRSELYPGRYTLAEGMSYGAAMDALSQPPVKRTTTVTIPEGYSRAQAAQLVEELGLKGNYTEETIRSQYLNPAKYGARNAANLEGFLFPDTFEMKPNAPAADLVQLQLEDFKRRIKGVDMSYASSKNLTIYDVLIIASLVEDEAGIPSQRKQVAAVVYNRLREGIPLGIDATIRFATGNYTQPLTESELAVDSPYNTRLNSGLPPGPINSPGLEAIEAAAHPARSDYLFYVNEPGTCGKLAFSKTNAEFEADVARYHAARDAAGGNEPDTCGE
jgi:UPF0755 protein